MKKIIFLITIILSITFYGFSQKKDIQFEKIPVSMIHANYAFQIPGGNMANLFGYNHSVGGGFTHKNKNNWLFGIDFNFMFGQQVKNEAALYHMLETSYGYIISTDGAVSEVRTHERGFNAFLSFGKLFSVLAPNPNSGFFLKAGAGMLTYKYRIDNVQGFAPSLLDDYPKGYDRLTAGFAFNESIGYLYLSNTRLANFFVSFDFMQSFSHRIRDYDFDLMQYTDKSAKMDYLYSIRIGWIFNLYKRSTPDYYYN